MSIKQKFSKERLARFFDREGFYIILFLCVCIVAITAVWVSRTGLKNGRNVSENNNKTTVDTPSQQTSKSGTDDGSKLPVTGGAKTGNEQKTTTPTTTPVKNTSSTSTSNNSEATVKFGNPVKEALTEKSIIRSYSPTELECFVYPGEWRVHPGVDIAANPGFEVVAAYAGKVADVRNDNDYPGGFGWTVEIDHGNGYKTVYSNLDENIAVKKGDTVKKGQKIGLTGNTSILEKTVSQDDITETHLHYEVLKKGVKSYENVDPMKYMTFEK
jgi:Membrane proteins related to metalloendopeptidases